MLLSWQTFQYFLVAGERPAIIAPPESEWYHGRLDRYSAEARLRGSGKLGSYLGEYTIYRRVLSTCSYVRFLFSFKVRESDRKPGSYVLSYCGRTGINHFR